MDINLSPLFPFNLLNYVLGVTQVSLEDYILGSISMIPGTIMYVISSLAGGIAMIDTQKPTNPILKWRIRTTRLECTVAVKVYVTRIARKALEQEL